MAVEDAGVVRTIECRITNETAERVAIKHEVVESEKMKVRPKMKDESAGF
jgi:PP-loop superfamily ATP-utilizing enzyme